jgi:hypothetical protein
MLMLCVLVLLRCDIDVLQILIAALRQDAPSGLRQKNPTLRVIITSITYP